MDTLLAPPLKKFLRAPLYPDSSFSIILERCFLMLVGWFDWVWMYYSCELGFLLGQYLPLSALNVTSRKLVCCMPGFDSYFEIVGFKSVSNVLIIIRSVSGPEMQDKIARPSSLRRPNDSSDSMFDS